MPKYHYDAIIWHSHAMMAMGFPAGEGDHCFPFYQFLPLSLIYPR